MDVLDLPEPLLHRLFVLPRRLRSASAARRAIEDAARMPDSDELRRFASAVGGPAVGVDGSFGHEGRVVLLAVLRTAYQEVAPQLVAEGLKRGFTIYDVESGTILSEMSTSTTPNAANKIRDVLNRDPDTGQGLGRAVELGLGAASADSLLPQQVGIGIDLPGELMFMLPVEVPANRQTKSARRRYLGDLRSGDSRVRRMAAFDLGGWGPDQEIGELLTRLRFSDPDPYVCAAASISCVARGIGSPEEYWQGLESDFRLGSDPGTAFRDVTLGMMLVAALASSAMARTPVPCEVAREALALVGERAGWLPALRALVDRSCPAGS